VIRHEPHDHQMVELDDLAEMMLKRFKELEAEQPPLPTGGEPRHLAEEMATAHYEWSRQRDAMRILLGVQLVKLTLEQL
jgi:hypothetical protein